MSVLPVKKTHRLCLQLGRAEAVSSQSLMQDLESAGPLSNSVDVVGDFEAGRQVEVRPAQVHGCYYCCERFDHGLAGDVVEGNCLSGLREEVSFRSGFADMSAAAWIQTSRDVVKRDCVNMGVSNA